MNSLSPEQRLADLEGTVKVILFSLACLWFLRLADAWVRPTARPRQRERVYVLHLRHPQDAERGSPEAAPVVDDAG